MEYPDVAVLKRPSNRPFATFGAHDPEGNYFDITQEGMQIGAMYTSSRLARTLGGFIISSCAS